MDHSEMLWLYIVIYYYWNLFQLENGFKQEYHSNNKSYSKEVFYISLLHKTSHSTQSPL